MKESGLYPFFLTATVCLCSIDSAGAFILSVDPNTQDPFVPWASTASGPRSSNGEPATLTWSIVPDGTTILDGFIFSLGGSDLIAFMNDNFDGDPNQQDLRQQPWFHFFADSFDRWSQLGGVTYVYELNDDGGIHSLNDGVLGVRGDVRIGGASIDGSGGTLAFNFTPSAGSDMVLDTDDVSFFTNSANNHARLRNTIMHEHGHGFGVDHVESSTDSLLMESIINTSFDGPQLDEVRAIHFFFGDYFEKSNGGLGNNSASLATDLGVIPDGGSVSIGTDANIANQFISPETTDFVSISNLLDTDYFSFIVSEPSQIDATLTPRGGTFSQAFEGETPTLFNASARSDLVLTIFNTDGTTILDAADVTPQGGTESILDLSLPTAGQYFIQVLGAEDTIQLYQLELFATATVMSCDLKTDGVCNVADMNEMFSQGDLVAGVPATPGSPLDLNRDSIVNTADITVWLDSAARFNGYATTYLRGDTDGLGNFSPEPRTVDITDFANFLTGLTGSCVNWECGNFDGDNDVDISDFSNHFLPTVALTARASRFPSRVRQCCWELAVCSSCLYSTEKEYLERPWKIAPGR